MAVCSLCSTPVEAWDSFTLLKCRHKFHPQCLSTTIQACPTCHSFVEYSDQERLRETLDWKTIRKETEKTFLGRDLELVKLYSLMNSWMYFSSLREPDDSWYGKSVPPFEDGNLHLAAKCVRKFSETTHKWYHISVLFEQYFSFRNLMYHTKGVYTLPFWCWCDGAKEKKWHRHMILVTASSDFKFVGMKIRSLHTAQDLIEAIGSVSRPSTCTFNTRVGNFYINRTLRLTFQWILSFAYEGGFFRQVTDHYHYHLSVQEKFVRAHPQDKVWLVQGTRLTDTLPIEEEFVLPIAKPFKLVPHPTPHFLYADTPLYFEEDKTLLTLEPKVWKRLQVESGNVMQQFLKTLWIRPFCWDETFDLLQTYQEQNQEYQKKYEDLIQELKRLIP